MHDLPQFRWYSPEDVSGHYGLTTVVCEQVHFGGSTGNPYSAARILEKAGEIISEL